MGNLKRAHQFCLMLSEDENEYIARRSSDEGVSANAFIRSRILRGGWRAELECYRKSQKCDLHELDVRRK